MKVMLVTDAYLPKMDGIVVSLINLSNYLAKNGHSAIIIAPEYKDYIDEDKKNITIHRFRSFGVLTYPGMRFAFPKIQALMKIVKKEKPDIIHTHTPGFIGSCSIIVAKILHIPIISTYHTSLPDLLVYGSPKKILKLDALYDQYLINRSFTKYINQFSKEISKLFKSKSKNWIKKKDEFSKKAVWAIMNRFYNRHDLVIAPSKRIKKELKTYTEVKTVTISNGIELHKFKKKKSYAKFPRLLHVGRLGFEKHIDIIIKSMKLIVDKHPNCVLDIVGDGPAKLSLKRLTKKLGIRKKVRFHGFITRDKLPNIYQNHEIFITASEMETQGLVILESMATGLPVIGVNMLAIPDVVKNNQNGYIVQKRDYETMAKKIINLIENPTKVIEMGIAARKTAKTHSLPLTMKKLVKIYQKMIE